MCDTGLKITFGLDFSPPLTNFVISGCNAKTGQISLQDDNRGQLDKDKLVEAFPPS